MKPEGFGTVLLPPALPEGEELTAEKLESLLNVLQRWIADTRQPENPVWMEARRAVPAVRKWLAEHGYQPPPRHSRFYKSPQKNALVEIDDLPTALARIRELEATVGAFYGGSENAYEPEPEPEPVLDVKLL